MPTELDSSKWDEEDNRWEARADESRDCSAQIKGGSRHSHRRSTIIREPHSPIQQQSAQPSDAGSPVRPSQQPATTESPPQPSERYSTASKPRRGAVIILTPLQTIPNWTLEDTTHYDPHSDLNVKSMTTEKSSMPSIRTYNICEQHVSRVSKSNDLSSTIEC